MRFLAISTTMLLAACGPLQFNSPPTETPRQQTSAPEPSGPPPDSNDLLMRPATEVTAVLGEPDLARGEDWARLWRYQTTQCTLLIYFYPDPANPEEDAWQVTHVAARHPGGGPTGPDPCIAAVAGRNAAS